MLTLGIGLLGNMKGNCGQLEGGSQRHRLQPASVIWDQLETAVSQV